MSASSLSRIWKVIGCLAICLPLTGCWSRVEINDRAFATMMYVDKGEIEGNVKLALTFALPNRLIPSQGGGGGSGTQGNPYDVVSKEGKNVAIAYRLIQSDLSRKINWGQLRVIVIGEGLAKRGIQPLLEFLAREPDFHLKAYVFITEGETTHLEEAPAVFERLPSEVLREFAKQRTVINTSLKDLLVARYYGNDTIISMLVSPKKKMISEKNKTARWIGTGGAAIIRDGKMSTKMAVNEMRGGLWIMNELKDAVISIHSPTDGGEISYRVVKAATKIKPEVRKDKIVFHITSKAQGDLVSVDSDLNPSDPKQHELVARELSKEVERRIKAALDKTQKIGADSFILGRYLEWNYPKEWKQIKNNWDTIYENQVEFDIRASIEVKSQGTITKSPWERWAG
ncbi:MAG: germination protein Ger(x)C family [Paenibacillaceae bacterium]|nr:germination protein Ger(x)C family [Paenibacillaceae bacterium]